MATHLHLALCWLNLQILDDLLFQGSPGNSPMTVETPTCQTVLFKFDDCMLRNSEPNCKASSNSKFLLNLNITKLLTFNIGNDLSELYGDYVI